MYCNTQWQYKQVNTINRHRIFIIVLMTFIYSSTGRPTLLPSCRVTRWSPCTRSTPAARWAPSALPPGAQAPSCQSPGLTSRSVQIISDLTRLHEMFSHCGKRCQRTDTKRTAVFSKILKQKHTERRIEKYLETRKHGKRFTATEV